MAPPWSFIRRRVTWLLTRPRTFVRSWKTLGLRVALQLVLIRLFGTPYRCYVLRIPGYPNPVFIRGGKSSDAVALYEVLVTAEYGFGTRGDSLGLIIDGGANIGMASLYFLNRYPVSRVIAVEPDPANFELCRLNLAPYGDRVRLFHGAIWKNENSLSLELGSEEWVSRVRDDPSGAIPAFTIKSLIAREPGVIDLLKLDIEGSEKEVFGPEAREWLPQVRNIAIELHGDDCKTAFLAALVGYHCDLSLHCTWTDPSVTPPLSCYLAICRDLYPDSAPTGKQASLPSPQSRSAAG